MVKVPLRRRDQFGWPAAIFAAVIHGLEISKGTLAIWAVSRVVDPVASLNGAAYEFSNWPAPGSLWLDTNLTNEDYASYPEFMAAQQWALRLDGGHIQRT